jgi:hypothetical protein
MAPRRARSQVDQADDPAPPAAAASDDGKLIGIELSRFASAVAVLVPAYASRLGDRRFRRCVKLRQQCHCIAH